MRLLRIDNSVLDRIEYFLFSEQVFDVFGYGTQVASRHKNRTEIEDRLHFFLEECDNLQVRGKVF